MPESDEDEDYIDTGAAILCFYCTLVDLLGRCAPDAGVIAQVNLYVICVHKITKLQIYIFYTCCSLL